MATSYPHFLQHVNLLLVGKTGNGKSSTGNSILGKKVFVSKSSTTSVTFEPKLETSVIDGQTISVTDVPGLSDTQFDKEENVTKARDWINKAIRLSHGGFHGIVLVIRFGNRFTEEDRESIEVLKSILGKRVIQDHGVCAITYGDALRWDIENGEIGSFKEWCSEQSGAFLDLLNECGQRCVLFDNVSKDGSVQKSQRNELIQEVMKLQDGGIRTYGVHELEKATRSQHIRSPSLNLMTTFELPMTRSPFANPHDTFGSYRRGFFQQTERDDSDETEDDTSTSEDEDDNEGNRIDTLDHLNQFLYQRKLRTWMYRNQPSDDGDSDDSSADSHNDDDSDKDDDCDKDGGSDDSDNDIDDDDTDDSDDDSDDDDNNGVEEVEEEQDEGNAVNDEVVDLTRYLQGYSREENQECRLL